MDVGAESTTCLCFADLWLFLESRTKRIIPYRRSRLLRSIFQHHFEIQQGRHKYFVQTLLSHKPLEYYSCRPSYRWYNYDIQQRVLRCLLTLSANMKLFLFVTLP